MLKEIIKKNNTIVRIYRSFIKNRNILLCRISPKLLLKIVYLESQHKRLNLKNPKYFNEKLIYLELEDYYKNELVSKCVDKYEVREYIEEQGCKEILNELYGVYEDANDINWNKLPQKIALKCTHGYAYNIICIDKEKLDKEKTIKQLNKWLKEKFGYATGELHYLNTKPRIICEKYLETNQGIFPTDYKIYCFFGEPIMIETCEDRANKTKYNFMDLNWNKLNNIYPDKYISKTIALKPENLDEMLEYARKLSKPFKFVRVDLYNVNGKTVFGELTFTPAGFKREFTEEAENKLSNMLKL